MGDAKRDERLERLERCVRQGLELLAAGLVEEARERLESGLRVDRAAGSAPISDHELERAFADAESEVERMRHADDVAHEAILQADLALEAEGDVAADEVGSHFATASMADLLERQGDHAGAERIRGALGLPDPAAAPRRTRREVVATLERWIENLRGGARG